MNNTPPWSRMRWHQPDRRTVYPIWLSRSAPRVWVRYRCMVSWVSWSGCLGQVGGIGGEIPVRRAVGLPEANLCGNRGHGRFGLEKPGRDTYLSVHDGAFPLPALLRGAAGEFLRPRRADAGRFPPDDQAEPAARDATGA